MSARRQPGRGRGREPRATKRPFRDPTVETSLRRAAEIGVRVLRKYHGRVGEADRKSNRLDLVTRADRESEARVLEYLRRRHPDHAIVAEESWDGVKSAPAGYTWILDPLDGTMNYAHGMDHYALSIAVAWDGRPVAGIVVDPARDAWYRAAAGRGAFVGRRRLSVSGRRRLAEGLITTGFPYDRHRRMDELMTLFRAFLTKAQGMRRLGVASLDLALVAAGQLDGFYEPYLMAWDLAAGTLLVTEAGGKVTDYGGRRFGVFGESVVAATPGIHAAMMRVIRATLGGGDRG